MTPDVVRVTTLPNFGLQVELENGESRRFNMQPYLTYPAFASLAEDGLFEKAHVQNGTVAWTDEMDVSPDTLYLAGERVPA